MSAIVTTFENTTNKMNRTSRYRRLKRLLNEDDEEYIETYETISIPESSNDSFHTVTKAEEDRLDLISFHYYKNPLLYWVIAEASGIIDPFNVPAGTVLRIPEKQSLFGKNSIIV